MAAHGTLNMPRAYSRIFPLVQRQPLKMPQSAPSDESDLSGSSDRVERSGSENARNCVRVRTRMDTCHHARECTAYQLRKDVKSRLSQVVICRMRAVSLRLWRICRICPPNVQYATDIPGNIAGILHCEAEAYREAYLGGPRSISGQP